MQMNIIVQYTTKGVVYAKIKMLSVLLGCSYNVFSWDTSLGFVIGELRMKNYT